MSDREMNTFQPGPKYWSQTYEWVRWNPVGGNQCPPPHHPQQCAGSRHWHCHWKGNQHGEWMLKRGGNKGNGRYRIQQANDGDLYPKPATETPKLTSSNREKTHGRAKKKNNFHEMGYANCLIGCLIYIVDCFVFLVLRIESKSFAASCFPSPFYFETRPQ